MLLLEQLKVAAMAGGAVLGVESGKLETLAVREVHLEVFEVKEERVTDVATIHEKVVDEQSLEEELHLCYVVVTDLEAVVEQRLAW